MDFTARNATVNSIFNNLIEQKLAFTVTQNKNGAINISAMFLSFTVMPDGTFTERNRKIAVN